MPFADGHACAINCNASAPSLITEAMSPIGMRPWSISGAIFAIDDDHRAFGAFDDGATEDKRGSRIGRRV